MWRDDVPEASSVRGVQCLCLLPGCEHKAASSHGCCSPGATYMVQSKWGKDLQGLCHLDVLDVSASSAQRSPCRTDPSHAEHPIRTSQALTRIMWMFIKFWASLMEAGTEGVQRWKEHDSLPPRNVQPSERNQEGYFTRNARNGKLACPQRSLLQRGHGDRCLGDSHLWSLNQKVSEDPRST